MFVLKLSDIQIELPGSPYLMVGQLYYHLKQIKAY